MNRVKYKAEKCFLLRCDVSACQVNVVGRDRFPLVLIRHDESAVISYRVTFGEFNSFFYYFYYFCLQC